MSTLSPTTKLVRLFPLGGLVFFPKCRLPLRIFEPRYKQMTEDALASDREIVMILPKAGPSAEPVPIHDVGTLGQIHNERKLPNGEFLMELVGVQRVRILHEIDSIKLYRQAKVELLEDTFRPDADSLRELQRTEIIRHLHAILPNEDNQAVRQYLTYLSRHCTPASFSDVVSYSSPIPLEIKQELLQMTQVDDRLSLLVETAHRALEGMVPDTPPVFPPDFSLA